MAERRVTGLLFDGWLPGSPARRRLHRPATVALDLALAAVLYAVGDAYAEHLHWTTARPIEWVAHVMLNAIALSVILLVAVTALALQCSRDPMMGVGCTNQALPRHSRRDQPLGLGAH